MGGYRDEQDRHDATYDWGGTRVREYVITHYGCDARVLDVGPCWGKYRDLLPEFTNVDGCEIWQPYVERYELGSRYRNVFVMSIYDLVTNVGLWSELSYDVVIFGDVLEHLRVDQAQLVLDRCREAVVVLPYEYAQDEEEDNPYEAHRQADLTLAVVQRRYPSLKLLACQMWNESHPDEPIDADRPYKGLYVKESAGWAQRDTGTRNASTTDPARSYLR